MAPVFEALQVYVLVAVCCFATSFANPITAPPTTVMATVVETTQSTEESYIFLIAEVEAFQDWFRRNLTVFKTDRMRQSSAIAPDMDINGFLTVKNDLNTSYERSRMSESELLPKHKLFLQNYEEVMADLKTEETIALATHPESYTTNFSDSYELSVWHIGRILYKVDEIMKSQGIDDAPSNEFPGFQAVPHNYQVHNTRSLFVLQSVDLYIDAAMMDFNSLRHKSRS